MEREINGKIVETDPEGYLVNLEDWSEELAVELAKEDKLELGEDHWKVLQKGLKEEFGDEWGDKKFLFELFPFGPAKQAGRYAGTPKPTGCV